MNYFLISFFLVIECFVCRAYENPPVQIDVYSPRGFSVSIPAEPGVTLFAFHGKLNEEMNGLEAGTWSRDITKARNGKFTFIERDASLKIGDILYFWTYALHEGRGYRFDNGEFVVRDFSSKTIDEVFPIKTNKKYEIPPPKIEIFYPKGFQVSIPADPAITVFAFHGKVNSEFDGLEAGTFSRDITKASDGRFIFHEENFELKINDTLYYWLYVIRNGLGFRRDNGIFVVREYDNPPIDVRADFRVV